MSQSWWGEWYFVCDALRAVCSYTSKPFKMSLFGAWSTTHPCCVMLCVLYFSLLRFLKLIPDQTRATLRTKQVCKEHDCTAQTTPSAIWLFCNLTISSPPNKSIANYIRTPCFMRPKAAHLHQKWQLHQRPCLLSIAASGPVQWSVNAVSLYLLSHVSHLDTKHR